MADRIRRTGVSVHNKASEKYADVVFDYGDGLTIDIAVPIVCRRAGLDLKTDAEIDAYLAEVYEQMHPDNWDAWREQQRDLWAKSSGITRTFFDQLVAEVAWVPSDAFVGSGQPRARIKAIKDRGYTIGSRKRGKHVDCILLPLPLVAQTKYEHWPKAVRAKIVKVLKRYDAYEDRTGDSSLLPDHKFPEVRWNSDTPRLDLSGLSEPDIKRDFQLLTNQRNRQKAEACRGCWQTNIRAYPMGIRFYYQGDESWPHDVPRSGKEAERGCIGCGWYDLDAWRQALIRKVEGGA